MSLAFISFDFSVEHMHFTLLSMHKCFASAYFQLSLTPEKSRKEKKIFGFNVQPMQRSEFQVGQFGPYHEEMSNNS